MPWDHRSSRRERLPSDWQRIRRYVLRRDSYKCTICSAKATDVDHIIAGDDHSLHNLQALCTQCHRKKSSSEGGKAGALSPKRAERKNKLRHDEVHPFFM